jgi:hypothetical protein
MAASHCFFTKSTQDQDSAASQVTGCIVEHLQGRSASPVQILEDEQQRLARREVTQKISHVAKEGRLCPIRILWGRNCQVRKAL